MQVSRIRKIIKKGEGIQVEFKECRTAISRDVYDTVCAFLNRIGGEILLGVTNDGTVTGIDPDRVEQIKTDFVTALNNPQKISPTFYLSIEEITIDKKQILYIYIPESSQVHRCSGRIYDRNEEGDFDITDNTTLVTALYLRKQASYSENKIYPYIKIEDLRSDLIARVRKLAGIQRPEHPWLGMNDFELLKSAQLHPKDYQTGKEGFSLAAVLLFGKDDVILSVLPHFRTDAITIKASAKATGKVTPQVTPQAAPQDERVKKIIKLCKTPRTREEIRTFLNLKDREYFRKEILNPLLEQGVFHPTIPDKLTSPNQKYYSYSNKSDNNL